MSWQALFRSKISDVDTALAGIQSNERIYLGGGAGVPRTLIDGLMRRADDLRNVELTHILTFGDAPYAAPEYEQSFRVNALFIGNNVRLAVQEGRADFTPIFLSEIPSLFRDGTLPLDVVLVSLTTPDEHGFCSFGVEVGTAKPAAEESRTIQPPDAADAGG
jgi:acetyl-CoA hydrolase